MKKLHKTSTWFKCSTILLSAALALSVKTAVDIKTLSGEAETVFQRVEALERSRAELTDELNAVKATQTAQEGKIAPETEKSAEPAQEPQKLTVTATAYCSCPKCCGIWSAEHPSRIGTGYTQKTASGTIPTEGRTIATDPSVIPTGSKVELNGNTYIAEDIGGAIQGNKIDIYFDTHEEALEWGKQTVEVTILDEE